MQNNASKKSPQLHRGRPARLEGSCLSAPLHCMESLTSNSAETDCPLPPGTAWTGEFVEHTIVSEVCARDRKAEKQPGQMGWYHAKDGRKLQSSFLYCGCLDRPEATQHRVLEHPLCEASQRNSWKPQDGKRPPARFCCLQSEGRDKNKAKALPRRKVSSHCQAATFLPRSNSLKPQTTLCLRLRRHYTPC